MKRGVFLKDFAADVERLYADKNKESLHLIG